MKKYTFASFSFLLLFLVFVGLYFTAGSGYYETEERKKTSLTEEQIALFEQDVKEGKEIDLENYLSLNDKNYDNVISSTALSVSQKIGEYFEKGLNTFFNAMASAMNPK